jgi:hypothetical protein
VTFSIYIQPIRLVTTAHQEYTKGKVAGWGAIDDYGTIADTANIASLDILSWSQCFKRDRRLRLVFWEHSFCAISDEGGMCQGDSGSGFYIEENGRYYLKGIVSSAIIKSCSETSTSIYTDMSKYIEFVKVIEQLNYSKNRNFICLFNDF